MSAQIPLIPVPAQQLSTVINATRFEITVRTVGGLQLIDIEREGVEIVTGHRLQTDAPVFTMDYQFPDGGNFWLMSDDPDEMPNYLLFGVSQFLVYLTPADIMESQNAAGN